jgi:hypothetical protein
MDYDEALAFIETTLQPKHLKDVQQLVFRYVWEGRRSYREIAALAGYDYTYIKEVGSRMWKLLSISLGEKVTKSNFRVVLRRRSLRFQEQATTRS